MSRLVLPLERSTRDVPRAYQRPDEYQDRVAKYIPAEAVGGYISLDGLIGKPIPAVPSATLNLTDTAFAQAPAAPATPAGPSLVDALLTTLTKPAGIVFLLCLVLAPLYVWALARRAGSTVWKAQALIAAFAFVVWAYAIKGTVFFNNEALNAWAKAAYEVPQFYDPTIGAALLVLFSMAVAFYQPKTS
jgi:hypothetical protein